MNLTLFKLFQSRLLWSGYPESGFIIFFIFYEKWDYGALMVVEHEASIKERSVIEIKENVQIFKLEYLDFFFI